MKGCDHSMGKTQGGRCRLDAGGSYEERSCRGRGREALEQRRRSRRYRPSEMIKGGDRSRRGRSDTTGTKNVMRIPQELGEKEGIHTKRLREDLVGEKRGYGTSGGQLRGKRSPREKD